MDGKRNSSIPRKPPYRQPPYLRTLPQRNDPHTMPFKTLGVVQRPLEEVFKPSNSPQITYSDREKIWTVLFAKNVGNFFVIPGRVYC